MTDQFVSTFLENSTKAREVVKASGLEGCDSLTKLECLVGSGRVFKDDGTDIAVEAMRILEDAGRNPTIPIFVYGTLMAGMPNHDCIKGSAFLGKAIANGLAMYDLGHFPGVKDMEGELVLGEIYECDLATLERLNALEGKGSLYDLAYVECSIEGARYPALTYVYLGDVDYDDEIPLQLQPYGRLASLKRTHVWYVSYGSNLLFERFMSYIEGGTCPCNGRTYPACSDANPPVDVTSLRIPYRLYFGNSSGSWDGHGVAFVDPDQPGRTYARAYLISREQYEHIRDLEGRGPSWYCDELSLGTMNGIPAVTFTNRTRRPANPPSKAYLDVMRKGFNECSNLPEEEFEKAISEALEG